MPTDASTQQARHRLAEHEPSGHGTERARGRGQDSPSQSEGDEAGVVRRSGNQRGLDEIREQPPHHRPDDRGPRRIETPRGIQPSRLTSARHQVLPTNMCVQALPRSVAQRLSRATSTHRRLYRGTRRRAARRPGRRDVRATKVRAANRRREPSERPLLANGDSSQRAMRLRRAVPGRTGAACSNSSGRSSTDQWNRPSPCPGWTVLGLTNHLVGGDLSLVSWLRDGHRGTPAPAGLDPTEFITWLDGLQIQWVQAARRLSPRLATELLDWLGDRVADGARSARPLGRHRPRLVGERRPRAGLARPGARAHANDGPTANSSSKRSVQPSDLRADLAGPVLDAMRWAYPFRLGPCRRPAGATVEIDVHHHELAANGSSCTTARSGTWPTSRARCWSRPLTMSAEQAWRLLTNNFQPDRHGPIMPVGDAEIVDKLVRTRAIIGIPVLTVRTWDGTAPRP